MTTTLPAPAPVVAPTGRQDQCRTCRSAYPDWDTTHPLFRPWSRDCPDCLADFIAADHQYTRGDDR